MMRRSRIMMIYSEFKHCDGVNDEDFRNGDETISMMRSMSMMRIMRIMRVMLRLVMVLIMMT